eukprot:CAMPEP_0119125596 /NCGR_PEP_ID=MMETSP1310-20130426/4821_1 /TAXON_ID=464262 /ORGANISM="Genus nov. species nov., Strain RCC2339" /LENGTH=167 /DNA_ID=CAMNT_0007115679 /DNA_START=331 /DNA_END=834 /DNA_ORIENTATION=+
MIRSYGKCGGQSRVVEEMDGPIHALFSKNSYRINDTRKHRLLYFSQLVWWEIPQNVVSHGGAIRDWATDSETHAEEGIVCWKVFPDADEAIMMSCLVWLDSDRSVSNWEVQVIMDDEKFGGMEMMVTENRRDSMSAPVHKALRSGKEETRMSDWDCYNKGTRFFLPL